jgi:hypothetical protein
MVRINPLVLSISIILILHQHVPVSGQGFLINQVKTLEIRNLTDKSYNEIEGSPYYTKDFIKSTIFFRDGNYSNQLLRYDMFRDEMEFNKEGKILWLIRKDIKYIRYGTDMIFVSSVDADTNKLGYYILKDDGTYLLFYKKTALYEPMVPSKGYSEPIPDRFNQASDLIFIKSTGNPAFEIRNKKDLLDYFAGNQSALDFIKKEKTRPDKLEDLHKLIYFLNEKQKEQ